MKQNEIILLADASGISMYGLGLNREKFIHYLEVFAKLVAQHEREACAKICDDWPNGRDDIWEIGNAIRARGQA
jgi:hypothetical protein